ncbi:MAG: hypothetical protein LUE61_05220 [Clostridiales bacterium]|nr:hypothetical protein [Clostridiales bacterium]
MFRQKKKDRQKHEFQPRSHALIYLLAIVYLAWLLVQMLQSAWQGGADAPTNLELAGGILVLGGGIVLLAVLAWKMSRLPPKSSGETSEAEEEAGQSPADSAAAPEAEDAPALNEADDADS